MPETYEEYHARTRKHTVQIDLATWCDIQPKLHLAICRGCRTYFPAANLMSGECVNCRPSEPLPCVTLHAEDWVASGPCGCRLKRAPALNESTVVLYHCTPEPAPEAPALMDEETLRLNILALLDTTGAAAFWAGNKSQLATALAYGIIRDQHARAQAEQAAMKAKEAVRKFGTADVAVAHAAGLGSPNPVCSDCNQPYGAHEGLTCPQADPEPERVRHVFDSPKPEQRREKDMNPMTVAAPEPEQHVCDWEASIMKDQEYCLGCDTHRKAKL